MRKNSIQRGITVSGRAKEYIVFDPVTCKVIRLTYKELSSITGMKRENLVTAKTGGVLIKSVGAYLFDIDVSTTELSHTLKAHEIKGEIWKDIEDADIPWQVSNFGRYRYMKKNSAEWKFVVIKLHKSSRAPAIRIRMNGKPIHRAANHFVMRYFMPEAKDGYLCYHKDMDIWNNRVDNLDYATKRAIGVFSGRYGNGSPVAKIEPLTGEIKGVYDSMEEGANKNFALRRNIWRSVDSGGKKLCTGYSWKRISELTEDEKRLLEEYYNE